jgi:hypothetical protein
LRCREDPELAIACTARRLEADYRFGDLPPHAPCYRKATDAVAGRRRPGTSGTVAEESRGLVPLGTSAAPAGQLPLGWSEMSRPGDGLRTRLVARARGVPTERRWERSALLEPRYAPRGPELVSDAGGLAFHPSALDGPFKPLDPRDPAVEMLVARLEGRAESSPLRKSALQVERRPSSSTLDGWRLIARTGKEALFGLGMPPDLVMVAVRKDARRGAWTRADKTAGRPLRVTRDGIRASSWRLDPTYELRADDTVLRILVTEQTYAGGKRADGRVLDPDLYEDEHELILTMFVTPLEGFVMRTPNPETPVRVALPGPVGGRELIDGAVYEHSR